MGDILQKLTDDPAVDHEEIQEWVASLSDLKNRYGAETTGLILAYLQEKAFVESYKKALETNDPPGPGKRARWNN